MLPSLPLCLPPVQSDAGAEIATWEIAKQKPSSSSGSFVFDFLQEVPVQWGCANWHEEAEAVLF